VLDVAGFLMHKLNVFNCFQPFMALCDGLFCADVS